MILTCGEALIDFFSQEEQTNGISYCPLPGGSPLNTAVAIARLGVETGFLSRISSDMFGELLIEHLRKNGIDLSFVSRSPDPCALSFVKRGTAATVEYAFYANGAADRNLTVADIPLNLPERIDCFQFGSIAMTMEPVATTIESFITRQRDKLMISFDPNIRPALIKDRENYLFRFEKWCASCSMVKLSSEDVHWLYPDLSLDNALNRMLALGPELVAVTLGEKGSLIRNKDHSARAAAYSVTVKDTVGAGDTFHGALLVWFHKQGWLGKSKLSALSQQQLEGALVFANKAAGINCSRQGADPPRLEMLLS